MRVEGGVAGAWFEVHVLRRRRSKKLQDLMVVTRRHTACMHTDTKRAHTACMHKCEQVLPRKGGQPATKDCRVHIESDFRSETRALDGAKAVRECYLPKDPSVSSTDHAHMSTSAGLPPLAPAPAPPSGPPPLLPSRPKSPCTPSSCAGAVLFPKCGNSAAKAVCKSVRAT